MNDRSTWLRERSSKSLSGLAGLIALTEELQRGDAVEDLFVMDPLQSEKRAQGGKGGIHDGGKTLRCEVGRPRAWPALLQAVAEAPKKGGRFTIIHSEIPTLGNPQNESHLLQLGITRRL